MKYYEAISNAIMRIENEVKRPVKLECNIREKIVKVYVLLEGRWTLMGEILDFDNVSFMEIQTFILGSIENAEDD